MRKPGFPLKQGLYDPRFEKDSCGIGFVAHIKGQKSHDILQKGLHVLDRMSHRGAQGRDPLTGDGAGVLLQIPHLLFSEVCAELKIQLPRAGRYGVGMVFLPKKKEVAQKLQKIFDETIREEGAFCLGWRTVPVHSKAIGSEARETEPLIRQVFIAAPHARDQMTLEKKLFVIRKKTEKKIITLEALMEEAKEFCIPSLSCRTIVYKGLLLPEQVLPYYDDLRDKRTQTAITVVHSRFSTNTFPSWRLAHPFRYICHNGEINTLRGNINWMRARQSRFRSELLPIVREDQSDSACLDNALEFLHLGGRSLPHAMMMLIPEPWIANVDMSPERRGFYEYHSSIMEPWDGPAAVCFTDGSVVGGTLDRNGLRPCRYQITHDDVVVLASETGVLPAPASEIREKGRLQPGKMFLVDTVQGRIVSDEEFKSALAKAKPYREWVDQDRIALKDQPTPTNTPKTDRATLKQRQQLFGYSEEEIKMVLTPMAVNGEEAMSSMGTDTPLAVLSDKPQLLFKYFRQLFAQVTNPPIDPIREQLVMSLGTSIGPRPALLARKPGATRRIQVPGPILTNSDLQKIRNIKDKDFKSKTLHMVFNSGRGAGSHKDALRAGLIRLRRQAAQAVREGYQFLILSDRSADENWAPIPSLLGISAVHHYLVKKSLRADVALIVESGEPRDVHHFATLIGYGAGSINPYLAFETIDVDPSKYISAVEKGLFKIISKMGISTIQSYCGGQIFEIVGLDQKCVDKYFIGTSSRIGGIGLTEIETETLKRHALAFSPVPSHDLTLGGDIHYRIQGETHAWNPETIAKLQFATRNKNYQSFKEFSAVVNDESQTRLTLRGLLDFDFPAKEVPLSEVEPASEIVKRFTTGAMSLGAISREAHETLALAMNSIGGKSNSGEGGEDPARFQLSGTVNNRNSAIKQIASARFGVTIQYLIHAKELQIKMAQGAKPGEGGQLPGYKVDDYIAKLRHSIPGVGLISPPPHHDIYSIEDLAQLIFDLKNANEHAAVSVKLVSEVGVGTVAAGVVKAHADKVLISGESGGTGASPLSSIKYAGLPWELGIAETHQTLMLNGLRSRVRVEVDGQMKTGRDVVVATLLGAEEYGFATAPLIVQGCIMMRKCHLNTCPVGIATQDPELRKKFTGQPEHVVNFFFYIAEEVRELMAKLGFRTINEMVGRVDRLKAKPAIDFWKATAIDLSPILHQVRAEGPAHCSEKQAPPLSEVLDRKLIQQCMPSVKANKPFTGEFAITNRDRTTGAMLSGEIARLGSRLAEDSVQLSFKGSAGQSFGAFLSHGITLRLEGEANDYVGKGLSGGKIVVSPPRGAAFDSSKTILIGNTVLFGATEGQAYFNGMAGERFAVRNSGAQAVVEGTGDHGCEYMTGGVVVVLGNTGRNFAAGMSGGVAFVFNESQHFEEHCNRGMVEIEKEISEEDRSMLFTMIESHVAHTGSTKGLHIIENWEFEAPKFVKVMPTDYKAALANRAGAKAHG